MRTPPSTDVMSLIQQTYPGYSAAGYDEVKNMAGLHDEQAFIYTPAGGTETYGPTVGVYRGPRVRTLGELQNGAVVAVIEVQGATTSMPPYQRLGLNSAGKQLYCVLLSSGSSGTSWTGAIATATTSGCSASTSPLSVRRTTLGSTKDDYDTGVMFDEDANGPTIGVPCGAGWCELANNLAASAQNPQDNGAEITRKVKGWHDEQRLATAVGGFKPSKARGSITPTPGLQDSLSAAYEKTGSGGYPIGFIVAEVMLNGPPPADGKYTLWNFQNGKSQMWIRKRGPSKYQAQFVKGNSGKEPNATDWVAIEYHGPHVVVPVPGVARWIWSPTDEGLWIACDQGCCEISQLKIAAAELDSLTRPKRSP